MNWSLLAAITLLFLRSAAVTAASCPVLAQDAPSTVEWSVVLTTDSSSLLMKIAIPDEYQYEQDQNNYILDLKLSFESPCAFGLNLEAATDPTRSWKIINDIGAWRMRYRNADLSRPDQLCGWFEFERLLTHLDASKLANCLFQEDPTSLATLSMRSLPVTGSLKRQYVARTRTLGVSRSVETVIGFDLSTITTGPVPFGSTLEGSALSNANISAVTVLKSDSNSIAMQFSINTFLPERIQLPPAQQGAWRDLSLTSNCDAASNSANNTDSCEHIFKATLIRKNPCFLPDDKFLLSAIALTSSTAGAPITATIIPQTFSCTISPVSVRKLSSWMRPVQGPSVTDPLAAWSAITRPTIPSALPTYFMLDLSASQWLFTPTDSMLQDLSVSSGATDTIVKAKQLISAAGCGQYRVCIIVAPIELNSYASSNAYTSLVLSAQVNVSFGQNFPSLLVNSWGLIDVLSSDVSAGYDGGGNYDLSPSRVSFSGDTVGFSIAIGAGIAVLLAAMVGFAVSFHTADQMDDDETGPAATGAGL